MIASHGSSSHSAGRDGEDLPLSGYTFQYMTASFFESEPAPHHRVVDRPRDKHLVRRGQCTNPGADMQRDSAEDPIVIYDLTNMEPDPQMETSVPR